MRERLNDNPLVTLALLGVLGIVVAFLFLSRMSSSSSSSSTAPATTTPTTASATGAVPAGVDPATVTGTPTTAPTAPVLTTATGPFEAGPGLPKHVVAAYDHGKIVVLLVFKRNGIDDRDVRRYVDQLSGKDQGVAIFQTAAKDVTDYSRIAVGVDLNRVPAIVVLEPSKKNGKKSNPQATVSYGFHGVGSIEQAIRDARYTGPENLPTYPR